jgi:single-strand DNA-binding protein
MPSFNSVTLVGNVTRDPELRFTPKGTAVVKVTLAINRKWKTESGEQKEDCSFVDCTAFGRSAETIGQYVKKGEPLLVSGRLQTESWDDKQTGQKRSKLAVVIENFQLLSAKRESSSAPAAPRTPPPGSPAASSDDAPKDGDDVPF